MKRGSWFLALALGAAMAVASCLAPPPEAMDSPTANRLRYQLNDELLALLPVEQRGIHQARLEALWLATTAYRASAAIGRFNNPAASSWLNNALVNSSLGWKDRGLCWQYQHDLYRELRRMPLQYFRIGAAHLNLGESDEHHVLYLTGKGGHWPHVLLVDAWREGGYLTVLDEGMIGQEEWKDAPGELASLQAYYPEGHRFPFEYWALVKSDDSGQYVPVSSEEGYRSEQAGKMRYNIEEGKKLHPYKLIPY